MDGGALFVATFLACAVESVEALTIVLAAGTARDWRSALQGVVAAVVALVLLVAVFGSALTVIPLGQLRLVVGGLLLIFGLGWLRKAILRAAGLKALHDEAALYDEYRGAAVDAAGRGRWVVADWYGFTLAFKGVLLEGLEVAFIVVTLGASGKDTPVAAAAALVAIAVVTVMGLLVRGPLTRVPENTMKFVVGTMLTGFGVFWGGEGAGARWPHGDGALLVIVPAVALLACVFTLVVRSASSRSRARVSGNSLGSA